MTDHVRSMLQTYPKEVVNIDQQKLAECIQTCFDCAQTCTACADACLAEDTVSELRQCIRFNLDCADVCVTTGKLLSRQTGTSVETTRAMLEACRTACQVCGDECVSHAQMHEHCKVCAEACRRCEQACTELLASLG